MKEAAKFFRSFIHWAKKTGRPLLIENPIMHKYAKIEIFGSVEAGKPTQIIQPWQFGHGETKATCLWLYNLPKLKHTNIVEGREQRLYNLPPGPDRQKLRSKTYKGIADAIAEQYTIFLSKNYPNNQILLF